MKTQLVRLFCIATLLLTPIASFATCESYDDCGNSASGNYGCEIGSYQGIYAYSNGGWTGNGNGCGKYQCVDYVKRVYQFEVGNPLTGLGSPGYASSGFQTWHDNDNLTQYVNGQSVVPPAAGDIYCLSGNVAGHVGIITDVNLSTMKVVILDQNTNEYDGFHTKDLSVDGQGRYSIAPFSGYTTQGWLRDPNYIGPQPIYKIALATEAENWGQFVDGEHATEATMVAGGVTAHFKVRYKNLCTFTWSKNQADPNWVGLMSCESNGSTTRHSFLNDPWNSSLGWMTDADHAHVRNFSEASVPPGVIATFEFDGYIPAGTAPQGPIPVYFSLHHATHGFISDGWGGLSFQVYVESDPTGTSFTELVGDFNGDGKDDVGLHNYVGGNWSVALSTGTAFTLSENYWATSFGTGEAYVPIVGDFNGDGKDDVGLHKNTGEWYVALSTGSSFNPTGTVWTSSFGTNPAYRPIVGDFNGDGKDDVGLHKNTTGQWYVALSTGSSFAPTGTVWASSFGTSDAYVAIVGDFDEDGKDDVGLHKTSGEWYVAFSTGSSFNPTGTVWASSFGTSEAYIPIVGDFNEDGKDDVGLHKNTSGQWYVALSTGSSFAPTGTVWAGSFGTSDAYIAIVGDFNEDGKDDVGLHKNTSGQWYGAFSTGTSFSPTGTVWLSTNSIEFGGSGKLAESEAQESLPSTFTLNQNYPNPFNPMTTIGYSLPEASHVTLTVYNILGQKVTTLVDEDQAAGEHSLAWDANRCSSGVYFYRIEADGITSSKKMLLLK